jgi:hypothetical protein
MTSLAAWCDTYGWVTLGVGILFLVAALAAASIETLAVIKAKREAAEEAKRAAADNAAGKAQLDAVEPVELLEALQGVLEALKGLPTWIALFLAGLALLWLGSDLPKACVCGPESEQCAPEAGDDDGEDDSSEPGNKAGGLDGSGGNRVATGTV